MTSRPLQLAKPSILPLLKKRGLRDIQPRRMVIEALKQSVGASSPQEIHQWIEAHGATINPVTVYRILALLEKLNLVHRQPESSKYFLCSMPEKHGQHGSLQCVSCGRIGVFMDADLAHREALIADSAGFRPSCYLTAILAPANPAARKSTFSPLPV